MGISQFVGVYKLMLKIRRDVLLVLSNWELITPKYMLIYVPYKRVIISSQLTNELRYYTHFHG